jgi:transposase
MAVADGAGLPIAIGIASATPHEVTLAEELLHDRCTGRKPRRVIGDKAYDSDELDRRLKDYGIELIAPNRRNRSKTQDGRPLRRYHRRWKIERLFAWLSQFRRLVTCWEFYAHNFLALLQLACVLILLRHF